MHLCSISSGPGLHWFVLVRREDILYEVFDSLGTSKSFIKSVLKHKAGLCDFNESPLQTQSSTACGEFCLFFILHRYFNEDLDLHDILDEFFTQNLAENEVIVKNFLMNVR